MLLSIFHNYCFWAYGGTVDTLVLGTSLARGESSNLSKPTKNYESYGRFQKRIKNKFKSLC